MLPTKTHFKLLINFVIKFINFINQLIITENNLFLWPNKPKIWKVWAMSFKKQMIFEV